MEKKSYTLILVNNRRGSTQRFVISSGWVKAGVMATLVLSVVGAAAILDYVGLLTQSIENRHLRTENVELRRQYQVVEGKLNALENGLERVKGFVAKLRAITDVDADDRVLKLAIGPLPKTGQSVPSPTDGHERSPAALPPTLGVDGEESVFLDHPTPNTNVGELVVEGQRDYASLVIRIDQAVKETQMRETGIIELWELLSEKRNVIAATPRLRPVRGWITSQFGYRVSPFTGRPIMHSGVDIAAAPGSPIMSPADGIVTFAGYDAGYGKLVSIDHGYGVTTRYGHTSQIFVEVGQKIKARDIVAAVGNTGRSTGPHLHYEVRFNGIPVDPKTYILDE